MENCFLLNTIKNFAALLLGTSHHESLWPDNLKRWVERAKNFFFPLKNYWLFQIFCMYACIFLYVHVYLYMHTCWSACFFRLEKVEIKFGRCHRSYMKELSPQTLSRSVLSGKRWIVNYGKFAYWNHVDNHCILLYLNNSLVRQRIYAISPLVRKNTIFLIGGKSLWRMITVSRSRYEYRLLDTWHVRDGGEGRGITCNSSGEVRVWCTLLVYKIYWLFTLVGSYSSYLIISQPLWK